MCPVCRSEVEHVQHVYLPTCTSLLNLTLTDNHQHRSKHQNKDHTKSLRKQSRRWSRILVAAEA